MASHIDFLAADLTQSGTFSPANLPLQPQRLMIEPAAVGCKRMLAARSQQRSGDDE